MHILKDHSTQCGHRKDLMFWYWFRLVFTLFFLYLTGDIFYRWDGFKYYSSFEEFLPAVALISVLWGIAAALMAVIAWIIYNILELCCKITKKSISMEHALLFISIVIMLSISVWAGKRYIFRGEIALKTELILFYAVPPAAFLVTWLLRRKAVFMGRFINSIQERVTPLVWLFGIIVFLSIPVVAYHTWIKHPENILSERSTESGPTVDKDRPNILLITFDAMTAKDMSSYGYHRSTTPFISTWAESSYLFSRVEAESNSTNPTTASLMTGKRLWTHQVYHQMGNKPVRVESESLPLLLKRNGFHNMAFVANPYASVNTLGISDRFEVAPSVIQFKKTSTAFSWGVEKIDNTLYKLFSNKIRLYDWLIKDDFIFSKFLNVISRDFDQTNVPPYLVFNKFLEALDDNPPAPYFAWLHAYPPHNPYLPPTPFMGMYEQSPKLRTYKGQLGLLEGKFHQEKADIARGRYDEFMRYCDQQFEDFIIALEKRGILNNTVVILSSDHGESFDHEFIGHNGVRLFESLTHIPLVIKFPHQKEGRVINALVEQIDIPATILDLAAIPVPSWMEGRSLVPLLQGENMEPRQAIAGFFENNYGHSNEIIRGTIAVWENDYKLIYYLGKDKTLLFNLKKDPDEMFNLFGKESIIGERLLTLALNKLKEANERILAEAK